MDRDAVHNQQKKYSTFTRGATGTGAPPPFLWKRTVSAAIQQLTTSN
jgi:hypothetical protein